MALRGDNGFFASPSSRAGIGSIYSTALLQEAFGQPLVSPQRRAATSRAVCEDADGQLITPAWYLWAVAVVMRERPSAPGAGCLVTTPPEPSGEVDRDVPPLVAWAQAQRIFGRSQERIRSDLRGSWAIIRGSEPRSAYVNWRLDQLEEIMGVRSTADQRPAPAPQQINDPNDLLDLWGYTERCQSAPTTCASGGVPGSQAILAAVHRFQDDLSLAAGVSVLKSRGAVGDVDRLWDAQSDRISVDTGLLLPRWQSGDSRTTYLAMKIAPSLVEDEQAGALAAEATSRLARVDPADTVTRLRLIAILKAAGGTAWKRYRSDVDRVVRSLASRRVHEGNVRRTIDEVDALRSILGDVPRPTVQGFDVHDARTRDLAWMVFANADMFAGVDDATSEFGSQGEALLTAIRFPSEPLVTYLHAINAVNEAGVLLSQRQRAEAEQGVQQLRGCTMNGRRMTHLFRAGVNPDAPCELWVTWQAIRSGLVVRP